MNNENILIVMINFFLIMIFVIFIWLIDISVSAMVSGGYLTNGWMIDCPIKMYHIGLYGCVSIFFIITLVNFVYGVYEKKQTVKENE